jgi:hypothetical protein
MAPLACAPACAGRSCAGRIADTLNGAGVVPRASGVGSALSTPARPCRRHRAPTQPAAGLLSCANEPGSSAIGSTA